VGAERLLLAAGTWADRGISEFPLIEKLEMLMTCVGPHSNMNNNFDIIDIGSVGELGGSSRRG
jgi:hypothetical protein